MDNATQLYVEEVSPANQIKGFTKSFVKRTKDKKTEDVKVKELLNYIKSNKVIFGAKVSEKLFKKNLIEKVFISNNCLDITAKLLKHYASLTNVEVVVLDIDSKEMTQKLNKPFLISVASIKKEA